ncbi:MAG: DNA adenine methylase [Pirellulales bacterium]
MKMSIGMQSMVKVIHGSNDDRFPIAGATVATVQENLADAFNIPIEAFGWVNGKIVGEDFRLRDDDILEFIVPDGFKGARGKSDDSDFQPIKTPFPYYGGKSRVAPEIWRRFGDVKNYVEPFFGGGGVLLNRPLMPGVLRKETVNDIDALLANFWKSAKQHPRKLAKVADYPVSELDLHARHKWLTQKREAIREKMLAEPAWCDPVVAAWWVWGISQWIGGGWCASDGQSRKKPSSHGRGVNRQSHWRPSVDGRGVHRSGDKSRGELLREYFASLSARLERVDILTGDWSRVVTPAVTTRYGITGVFLDPPYTKEADRKTGLYAKDDLKIGHHVRDWAVQNGGNPKLRIALCGYFAEYKMPPSWSVFEWKSLGSRNGKKERIWFSPHCLS